MIAQQKQLIEDLQAIADTKTEIKAKSLIDDMNKEQEANKAESEVIQLKARVSEQRDEILQYKEKIMELREELAQVEPLELLERQDSIKSQKSQEGVEAFNEGTSAVLEEELKSKESEIELLKDQISEQSGSIEELQASLEQAREKSQKLLIQKEKELERIRSQRKDIIGDEFKNLRQTINSNLSGEESSSSTGEAELSQPVNDQITKLEEIVRFHMQKESSLMNQIRDLESTQKREQIDLQYLKNIIIKYLLYLAGKKKKDAKKCEKALYTVLCLQPDEIKRFETLRKEAKKKASMIWGYLPQGKSKVQEKVNIMPDGAK